MLSATTKYEIGFLHHSRGFRGSWARTRLLPGRTKELWVGARRVEIVMGLGLGLDRHPVTSGSWGFDVKSFLYVLNALPKRSGPPTPSWWSGGPWSFSSPSPLLHTYSCWLLIHQTNSNEIFLFDLDNKCHDSEHWWWPLWLYRAGSLPLGHFRDPGHYSCLCFDSFHFTWVEDVLQCKLMITSINFDLGDSMEVQDPLNGVYHSI